MGHGDAQETAQGPCGLPDLSRQHPRADGCGTRIDRRRAACGESPHGRFTPYREGSLQHLEVRHRAHARVEDRIRCGKTTGFGRFPSRHFQINAAWLELSLAAIDLLA